MSTRCVAVAAIALLVGAADARGADFFLLHPNVASPGERVTVTYGTGRSDTAPVRFALYLVRNDEADAIRSPADPRLRPLGVIAIGERSDGSLSFVVPRVRGGTYTIASRRIGPCPHAGICGPAFYAAGVGEQIVPRYRARMTLRIEGGTWWAREARRAWPLVALVGVAAIAVLAGAAFYARRAPAPDAGPEAPSA